MKQWLRGNGRWLVGTVISVAGLLFASVEIFQSPDAEYIKLIEKQDEIITRLSDLLLAELK